MQEFDGNEDRVEEDLGEIEGKQGSFWVSLCWELFVHSNQSNSIDQTSHSSSLNLFLVKLSQFLLFCISMYTTAINHQLL